MLRRTGLGLDLRRTLLHEDPETLVKGGALDMIPYITGMVSRYLAISRLL